MPAAIYPNQLELYMESRRKGLPQETAAAKAGISKRTAQRIDSGTHRPQRLDFGQFSSPKIRQP